MCLTMNHDDKHPHSFTKSQFCYKILYSKIYIIYSKPLTTIDSVFGTSGGFAVGRRPAVDLHLH